MHTAILQDQLEKYVASMNPRAKRNKVTRRDTISLRILQIVITEEQHINVVIEYGSLIIGALWLEADTATPLQPRITQC